MERAHRCLQLGYCGLPYGLGQARAAARRRRMR